MIGWSARAARASAAARRYNDSKKPCLTCGHAEYQHGVGGCGGKGLEGQVICLCAGFNGPMKKACPTCHGTGVEPASPPAEPLPGCPECGGCRYLLMGNERTTYTVPCPTCGGTGKRGDK